MAFWPFGKKKKAEPAPAIQPEVRTNPDGSKVVSYQMQLKGGSDRPVRDDVVTIMDNALSSLGGEVMHAMDPRRIVNFMSGGPPVWSVGIVSVPGPTPYTLLVTYGFSHVLSPSSFREGMQHEYSIALPAGTDPSPWADALLRHMARYVLSSGKDLIVGDVMPCHAPITCSAFQPEHHAMMPQTDLVGLVVGRDPALPSISTPHGAIEVRRFVGVDQLELDRAETWFGESFLEEYAKDEPLLLSALDRPSAMANAAFRERCAARAAREGSAQSAVMLGVSWRDTGDAFEIDIPGGREFHKLRDALRGRLPHGRTLMVVSRTSSPLLFQPGEGFGIEPTPQGLLIHGDLSHPQFQIFIGDVGGDSGASSRVARFRYA